MKRLILVIASVVCVFAALGVVEAKQEPYVELPGEDWGGIDNPLALPDDLSAFILFGRMDTFGDVDAFAQTVSAPVEDLPIEVLVPVCGDHFAAVYPSVAVIGAGLDVPDAELPFELPDGMGAMVMEATERSERRVTGSNWADYDVYQPLRYNAALPEAGTYVFAVWEPEGNVGAYMLSVIGDEHAEDMNRSGEDRDAAFDLINHGEWLGADCNAAVAAADCAPTQSEGTGAAPDFEQRNAVGEGYRLAGIVLDSSTCLPIAGAQVSYWLTNEQGEYDPQHEGYVLTNVQGRFMILSNVPARYADTEDMIPHIHLQVNADGYQSLITTHELEDGETSADLSINVRPS
jgi:hypothetical protein